MSSNRKTQLSAEQLTQFTSMYLDPNVKMEDIAECFGRRPGTLYRWGFEYGLKRPKVQGDIQMGLEMVSKFCLQVSRELPPNPAPMPAVALTTGRRPFIDFILFLSDLHTGRQTISYNAAVFAARMQALSDRLYQQAKRFTSQYSIGKLNIFSLGDLVSGERVGQMITFEELEHAVLTQVYGIAIPRLVQFTEQQVQRFGTVDVYAVKGNHGIVAKPAISAANWDSVVNLGWQAKMANNKQVTFDVEVVDWYNYATVKHLDWLLCHGDQVRGGNPYAGLVAKKNQWHQSLPEHFDYIACGHFHHWNKIQNIYMNGTLVTDDDWSRGVVGRDGECVQLLLAVSDKGIEDVMPIWLDDVTEEDA